MAVIGLFDIGRTTLLAARRALDTTAHNVANAATPGYTRQEAILENIPSGTMIGTGVSGRGVRTIEVRSMYDAFTSLQLMTEKSNLSYWNAYNKGVVKIENIFNEAGDIGISPAITGFFNSWHEVAQSPEGHTQRTLLIRNAEFLSLRIRMAHQSLSDLRSEIFKSSQSLVNEANSITSRIAELNEQIASSPGALDLKDQRNHLLERLNQIARVTTFEDNAGRYNILIGGTPLVDGGKVYRMSVSTDIADNMQFHVNLPHEARNVTTHMAGGELKANLDLRDTQILGYMNRLDTFAYNLAIRVNTEHRLGFGLDGINNRDFFVQPVFVSGAAREMRVAITDPRHIAAALDATMLPGDNTNARAIADLINRPIIAGSTPVDFYRSMVADAGVEAKAAETSLRFYSTIVGELERKRQEISGVSLDEEAANLIKFQKLFEAAARMIRVADELLTILINMTGR